MTRDSALAFSAEIPLFMSRDQAVTHRETQRVNRLVEMRKRPDVSPETAQHIDDCLEQLRHPHADGHAIG